MAGNRISMRRRRSRKRAALLALSLCLVGTGTVSAGDDMAHKTGDSVTTFNDIGRDSSAYGDDMPQSRPVRTIESHTDGAGIGCYLTNDEREYWRDNVTVDVSGSGGGSLHRNVTGIYLLDGAQLSIGGDLTLRLANSAPATCGATPGADVAHYYMSGIYAGYGGQIRGRTHGDTRFTLGGTLDMDVVGVGLQANKDGYITVGGGRIVTHALGTDTYALLAEEGSVFMNTGADGRERGTETVNIHGNLGVLHKNYGIDPNPDRHGSFISLALPTADSVLTGAILNEFEESGGTPTTPASISISRTTRAGTIAGSARRAKEPYWNDRMRTPISIGGANCAPSAAEERRRSRGTSFSRKRPPFWWTAAAALRASSTRAQRTAASEAATLSCGTLHPAPISPCA